MLFRKKDIFGNKYPTEKELLKKYGMADHCRHVRLLCISDTHGCFREPDEIPPYDAVILLGDHTFGDVEKILKVFPKDKMYGVLGNHDDDWITKYGIEDLHGNKVEINGVSLIGFKGCVKYKEGISVAWEDEDSLSEISGFPRADVLISHDGTYRTDWDYTHRGIYALTEYIYKNHVSMHLHGHIHRFEDNTLLNGTHQISLKANVPTLIEV